MLKFFRMANLSFRALFGWLDPKIYLIINVIDPVLQIIFYGLLVRYTSGGSDITPWIIGNAFLLCTRNAVFVVGSLLRSERYEGTLMLTVASPANKFMVFIARSFFNLFEAALTVVIGLLAGVLLFHIDLSHVPLLPLALSVLTAMLGGMSFGLVLSSLALVMREVHMFLNIAAMLLFVLTGASFPLERLPKAVLFIAQFVPVTRSIAASRLLTADGIWSNSVQLYLIQDTALSLLYMVIAYGLFRYFEYVARVHASLDLY